MNSLFASMVYVFSRRLVRHQGRPLRDAKQLPLWRLLVDEVVYLAGLTVRHDVLVVWLPALVVASVTMVGFAEATPGPVIPLGWRLAAAGSGGLLVAVAMRWTVRRSDDR